MHSQYNVNVGGMLQNAAAQAPNAVISSINDLTAVNQSLQYHVDEQKRKKLVCVHWIKQRCTRGETCDYLHSYDADKLPICRYFTQNGSCHKEPECVYRHPKATDAVTAVGGNKKAERCPYYERCFCKLGNFGLFGDCQFQHLPGEQKICPNYLQGFCPLGPECPDYHLKSLLNPKDIQLSVLANFPPELNWCEGNSEKPLPPFPVSFRPYGHYEQKIICHRCGVEGHKSTYCQEEKLPDHLLSDILTRNPGNPMNLSSVTCFSCNLKGHYANACPNKALMKQG